MTAPTPAEIRAAVLRDLARARLEGDRRAHPAYQRLSVRWAVTP